MKKALSIILSLGLLAGTAIPAFAASNEATQAANTLYSLGLFKGTWTNDDGTPVFDLDRSPTRSEAITMLVRLLGKETEALSGTWQTPFYDVADWAIPYVGYAYTNGLTTGTGDNTFGGEDVVSASQYLTFVLRALGYDSNTDFQWDKAWELSDALNITAEEYNAVSDFTRGDVAIISFRALSSTIKGSQITLYSSINPISDEELFRQQVGESNVTADAKPMTPDSGSGTVTPDSGSGTIVVNTPQPDPEVPLTPSDSYDPSQSQTPSDTPYDPLQILINAGGKPIDHDDEFVHPKENSEVTNYPDDWNPEVTTADNSGITGIGA